MINGMHAIVFSSEAEKVRDFFADVIGLSCVDAGGGWLIFALPPAELAVHPADGESRHQLYLMCDDIHATLAELRARGAEVAQEVSDQRWGLVAAIRLPDLHLHLPKTQLLSTQHSAPGTAVQRFLSRSGSSASSCFRSGERSRWVTKVTPSVRTTTNTPGATGPVQ